MTFLALVAGSKESRRKGGEGDAPRSVYPSFDEQKTARRVEEGMVQCLSWADRGRRVLGEEIKMAKWCDLNVWTTCAGAGWKLTP